MLEWKDALLAGLAPVVWQCVEWLKDVTPIPAPILSLIISSVLVLLFAILPETVQDLLLTVAIPMAASALLHEGKKMVE